ncbi:MAG TPA: hypothetical protein DDZ96_05530 [Porphyromonadaceae bacterium]|nr:hypothetical protein [Porphyromonadaceae bacterium]HBL33266.1 hypothetical protein [Porphyromonadaceae bacterium]HBX19161.1 hypothetical protein [Porphyromonadaceae bacterium]HBX44553.1 hypothetical protein [Porphyromonadaceae bacterium]HCM21759.1 hypothetical protein [Porphyromonadaceae bacterium]
MGTKIKKYFEPDEQYKMQNYELSILHYPSSIVNSLRTFGKIHYFCRRKNSFMQEDKSRLLSYAMYAGLYLGLFWVVQYFFTMAGTNHAILAVIDSILSIGTPILLFYYLVRYKRLIIPDSRMNYWHGMQFSILLFFFASLLKSVIVFIHVNWIDPMFITTLYDNMVQMAQSMKIDEALIANISEQPYPTPSSYIINTVILGNVFMGMLLSVIIVPLAMNYKSK